MGTLALLVLLAVLTNGCVSVALPTPDRNALVALPTATPTLPTPAPSSTLAPRPTDTPTGTPTPEATATSSPTSTPTNTATATATATPTVTPTATPGPLAMALGFLDDLLAGLQADGYELVARQATGSSADRVTAFIVQPPTDDAGLLVGNKVPRLLVYRQQPLQDPQLLWADEGSDQIIQFAGLGYTWNQALGWRDINGDGLLELAIWSANGGFCWACTRVYILQLVSDSTGERYVQELTGAVPFLNLVTDPYVPKWLNDLDGDGQPEIEVLDGRFEFAFGLDRVDSPAVYRVYDWDGTRYVDASWRFPGYLDYQIQRAREELEATYGQPLQSAGEIGQALRILLAYEASNRRDQGWNTFLEVTDPGLWSGEAQEGAVDLLLQVREYLSSLYELGEPFVPWPPTVPEVPPSNGDLEETSEPLPTPT